VAARIAGLLGTDCPLPRDKTCILAMAVDEFRCGSADINAARLHAILFQPLSGPQTPIQEHHLACLFVTNL
jgi:hypothetical protein